MSDHKHSYEVSYGVWDFGRFQVVGCLCGDIVHVASTLRQATKEEQIAAYPDMARIYEYEEAHADGS